MTRKFAEVMDILAVGLILAFSRMKTVIAVVVVLFLLQLHQEPRIAPRLRRLQPLLTILGTITLDLRAVIPKRLRGEHSLFSMLPTI